MDDATWRVIFSGQVQGVGFRYFVDSLASDFPVGGYVRNLGNGNVEVIAVGHFAALESFVNEIKTSGPGYVDQVMVDREYADDQNFESFSIRR